MLARDSFLEQKKSLIFVPKCEKKLLTYILAKIAVFLCTIFLVSSTNDVVILKNWAVECRYDLGEDRTVSSYMCMKTWSLGACIQATKEPLYYCIICKQSATQYLSLLTSILLTGA